MIPTEAQQIGKFIKDHFGIDTDPDFLDQMLQNETLANIISSSMESARRQQAKAAGWDRGFSYRDDYYKNPKKPPRQIPGLAYDEQGRRMPHVELFREEAEAIMAEDPDIVVKPTRTGVRIVDYKKRLLFNDK